MIKLSIWFGLLIFLIAIVFIFYENSQSHPIVLSQNNKEQALGQLLKRQVNLSPTIASSDWVEHESDVIAFSYPIAARTYTNQDKQTLQQPGNLDMFTFETLGPRVDMYISVRQGDNLNTLDDATGVSLRKKDVGTYAPFSKKIAGQAASCFLSEQENVEENCFVLYQNKLFTFTVRGLSKTSIETIFSKVLSSTRLK